MRKVALITGGTGGIGAAIATRLHEDGYEICLHYHRAEARAKALAAALDARIVCADFRDEQAIIDMMAEVGPLDVLVNNAGMSHYGLFTDDMSANWASLRPVNLDAALLCANLALPAMISKKDGVIINISSVWGMVGASCEVLYATTKAALIGFTKALAKELAPSNIRVNCIAPGAIETDMLARFSAAECAALVDEIPLGRLGQADDVAHLAAFLASPKATYLSGQVLSPNGGLVI